MDVVTTLSFFDRWFERHKATCGVSRVGVSTERDVERTRDHGGGQRAQRGRRRAGRQRDAEGGGQGPPVPIVLEHDDVAQGVAEERYHPDDERRDGDEAEVARGEYARQHDRREHGDRLVRPVAEDRPGDGTRGFTAQVGSTVWGRRALNLVEERGGDATQ